MSKKVAKALREGVEILRNEGWTQESYCDPDGRYCLYGAAVKAAGFDYKGQYSDGGFNHVGGDRSAIFEVETALDAWFGANLNDGYMSGTDWNDTEGRTVDEVTALMERIADEFEAVAS